MPCAGPLIGYRSKTKNDSGKHSIVWNLKESFPRSSRFYKEIPIPCGQCIYCRLEKSRQWAIRCFHEASLYQENAFVTLTYANEHLPEHGTVEHGALSQFMKDLRDKESQKQKLFEGVRSFGCAEYGENFARPHYHVCLFNCSFPDKQIYTKNREFPLYTSQILSQIWPWGHATIGDLTFESAAYVARYVTKKLTGPEKQKYEKIKEETGEIYTLAEERALAISRMPGIGRPWWDKYGEFTRKHDYVIIRGQKMRPPKYYDALNEKYYPEEYKEIKKRREKNAQKINKKIEKEDNENWENYQKKISNYHEKFGHVPLPMPRVEVMEKVQELKAKQLKRGYENGKT